MKKINEIKEKLNDRLLALSIFAFTTIASISPALADDVGSAISSGVKQGTEQIYRIITSIVLPIAVVALAICAIQIIWGSDRAGDKAKGAAIRIVIAIAIVYAAPLIVSEVGGWFSGLAGSSSVFS